MPAFPEEILLEIFQHLTIRGRLTVSRVCRQWRRLSLVDVQEFAIGSKDLEALDRHLPMTNHFISDDEMKRLHILNLVLNRCGRSLRKLQLSGLDLVDHPRSKIVNPKPLAFYVLFLDTVQLLIKNCTNLRILIFDAQCKLQETIFQAILANLGHQLTELYFGDAQTLRECSLQLAMDYLKPNQIRKLSISFPSIHDEINFFSRFPHLTSLTVNQGGRHFEVLSTNTNITNFSVCNSLYSGGKESLSDSFLSKLRSFRVNNWVHFATGSIPKAPEWLLQLGSLEVLSVGLNFGWQVKMLADHLPKLKEVSLRLFFLEIEDPFAPLLKLKNLKVIRLGWFLEYFLKMNFKRACSLSQVTFLEMFFDDLHFCQEEDITSFLSSLPRMFPNLQHFDVCAHTFRPKTLLTKLKQLKKLKRFALTTCNTHDDFVQNRLIPVCNRKNIQLLWDNRYPHKNRTFDRIEQTQLHWARLERVWSFE